MASMGIGPPLASRPMIRKYCAVPRTRPVVRSMLQMPMPADCSASASMSASKGSAGSFLRSSGVVGAANVEEDVGNRRYLSGWSYNRAAISIVPDRTGDGHPSSVADTVPVCVHGDVGGNPCSQPQQRRSRAPRCMGSRRRRLPTREPRHPGRTQRLRPRELQEGDPELAHRRAARRRVLVRGASHAPVRGAGSSCGPERSLHSRGARAHPSVGTRARQPPRPAVWRSLHVLSGRPLLSS